MRLLLFFFCISLGCTERVEPVVQEPSASSKVEYKNDAESLNDLKKKLVEEKNINADLTYKQLELTSRLKQQEKVLLKSKRKLRKTKARCKRAKEIHQNPMGMWE